MTVLPSNNPESTPLRIRRGRVESVDLYEVKDTELEIFEKGSPADLQLNFAVFLLSLAFSAVIALTTATFTNHAVQTAYIVVVVVGILMGGYLLIAWFRNRSSTKDVCILIRRRMKEALVMESEFQVAATKPGGEPSQPTGPSNPTG